jgi:flagellar hook-associated protein 1
MAGLFTSLGLAGSALDAASAAVRTTGQNIANANTEGYTRQRVQLSARPADQAGSGVQIGTGVQISRVERLMDGRLEEQIRNAGASLADLEARDRTLGRIEDILGDLDSNSIASALSDFFDAASDLANRPEDHAARALLLAKGDDLAVAFQTRDEALRDLRKDVETEVATSVGEVNSLASQIAVLNGKITESENGGIDSQSANDLRDKREELVKQLADLVGVRTVETATGSLNVLVGSDFLVFGDTAMPLTLDSSADGDVVVSTVRFEVDGKPVTIASGKLAGLIEMRDSSITSLREDLDRLASALISEVNRVHTGGEGLVGWTDATSTAAVADPNAALSEAGLVPEPVNGSFELHVANANTGLTDTYTIRVDPGTTVNEIASRINAAVASEHPQITASVTIDGRLRIRSAEESLTFTFGNDSSGALAGLGLGTFFSGTGASGMAVNQALVDDPRLIATGQGGGATDAANIQAIIALRDSMVLEDGSATFEEYYQGVVGVLGVDRSRATELLENGQAIAEHLQNQRSAISGVNMDEESIDLIRYQRAYQGAARFLTVIDSLLEALLSV